MNSKFFSCWMLLKPIIRLCTIFEFVVEMFRKFMSSNFPWWGDVVTLESAFYPTINQIHHSPVHVSWTRACNSILELPLKFNPLGVVVSLGLIRMLIIPENVHNFLSTLFAPKLSANTWKCVGGVSGVIHVLLIAHRRIVKLWCRTFTVCQLFVLKWMRA